MYQAEENERGAVLVEFGLIAPIMITLLLGIVQFGLVLNQIQGLHSAAREGARTAAIPAATNLDIEETVELALIGTTGADPTITITPELDNEDDSPCAGRAGETVEVVLDTTYELVVPFVAGRTLNIQGRGSFRCER